MLPQPGRLGMDKVGGCHGFSTFTIIARDPATSQLGIAMASKLPCVGSFCPLIRPMVGAVVAQAWTNPALPPAIIQRLEANETAQAALDAALAEDAEPAKRQVGLIDAKGDRAVFTGDDTDPWQGAVESENILCFGNMLQGPAVLEAMLGRFEETAGEDLAARLLKALGTGFAAGGDVRGNRSAALKVMGGEVFPVMDLRVDDHEEPMDELRRLFVTVERDFLLFRDALPTRTNPKGRFDEVRDRIAPKRG